MVLRPTYSPPRDGSLHSADVIPLLWPAIAFAKNLMYKCLRFKKLRALEYQRKLLKQIWETWA